MNKRSSESTISIFMNLRELAGPIFATSIFYRLISFIIFIPLVSGLASLFLAGSGRVVVSNEEIADFFIEPIGLVALIVLTTVGLALFALEQACLMTLTFMVRQKTIPMAVNAFKHVLFRVFRILELAGRIVLKILITSIPFLIPAGLIYILLLSEHDINYYLTEQPPVFRWALATGVLLGICLIACLIILASRVMLALPVVLFETRHPKGALQKSKDISKGRRLGIAASICAWGIGIFLLITVSVALSICLGKLLVLLFIGYTAGMVFILGAFFLFFSLTQLMINIFSTASFSMLVMHFYGKLNPSNTASKPVLKYHPEFGKSRQIALSGRFIIIVSALLAVAAMITGWLLLSNVQLEDHTEIYAHRGSSNAAPENTLAAVDRAIADRAHWVEIDVQRTADNRVVVVHDRDLMKIGGKPYVVTESSYSDLAGIDIGSWFDPGFKDQRITLLKTLLDRCRGRINVNIELKYYGWDEQLAYQVIKIVEDTQMADSVVIMSLKLEAIDQVKTLRPEWKAGLLTSVSIGNLMRTNADFLAVHSRMVTPGFVSRAHRAGKDIMVWTINDTVGMTKYFGMNVDGLITDEPALAIKLLEYRAEIDPVEKALVGLGLLVVGEIEHVDPETDGL